MAHNVTLTDLVANTMVDAATALLNSGKIKIYTTPQPATADTAITSQTLLATLTFDATAFGAAVDGVATANAIVSDTSAAATGTAVWARVLRSNGTTKVFDGTVGTSGCDINLPGGTSITMGGTVSLGSMTYTLPQSA